MSGCTVRRRCASWRAAPDSKKVGPGDPGNVTADDIAAMIKKQSIAPIGESDCVFVYTGHGDIWHPSKWDTFDAAEKQRRIAGFNAGGPGFDINACNYLAQKKIILWGGDTWVTEAVGAQGTNPFECHVQMTSRRGIWNLENLDLSQLVSDKA